MRPALSSQQRTEDQAQRGIGAQRLIDDDLVKAWFEAEHVKLVSDMLNAELADDAKRRECAMLIRTLASLKSHLEAEAAIGRAALKKLENRHA